MCVCEHCKYMSTIIYIQKIFILIFFMGEMPTEARRGCHIPGGGVTEGYESPSVGDGSQTQALFKSNTHF